MPLDDVQGRILGSLVEKELATPQQYPLTVNALLLACNQTSNREPVMLLSESDVQRALEALKAQRLVRFVFPSHGRSATRYRHVLDETLGLDEGQRALMGVLLLRGPQTVGELRARTERLARFDRLDDVEAELRALAARSEPLVVRLDRRPGQKEERYRQVLAEEGVGPGPGDVGPRLTEAEPPPTAGPPPTAATETAVPRTGGAPSAGAAPPGADGLYAEVAALRDAVTDLRSAVAAVHAELEDLRHRLGD